MSILRAIVTGPWVERVGWTLFHSLWQLAAVGLLLALAMTACRRRSPQFRYAVAVAALLLSALLPLATWLVLPVWDRDEGVPGDGQMVTAPQPKTAAETSLRFTSVSTTPPEGERFNSAENSQLPNRRKLLSSDLSEDGNANAAEFDMPPAVNGRQRRTLGLIQPWLGRMVALWGVGVFALSLWHVGGWLLIGHVRRRGCEVTAQRIVEVLHALQRKLKLNRTIRLIETSLVQSPAMCGWLKPVVLLPAGLATGIPLDQLEALLAHELAHIRRHDLLVNVLQAALETLLFYHPAVWWVSHRVRIAREFCTDQTAASVCGNALVYAQALATLEERRSRLPELALAANDGDLRRRIETVLSLPGGAASAHATGSAGLFALLLVASLTLVWSADSMTAAVEAPVPKAIASADDRAQPESTSKPAVSQSPFDALQRSQLSPELVEMLDIDHPPGELVGLIGTTRVKHWNLMKSFSISPDGKLLATGGRDRIVKLWNIETGRLQRRIDTGGTYTTVVFSPDGKYLAMGSHEFAADGQGARRIMLWDLRTDRQMRSFDGYVGDFAFSPNGQRIVSRKQPFGIKVWDVATGRELLSFEAKPHRIGRSVFYTIWDFRFSPDGQKLVTVGGTPSDNAGDEPTSLVKDMRAAAVVWNAQTGEQLHVFKSDAGRTTWSAPFSRDGKLIATAEGDGTISLWDSTTFKRVRSLVGHENPVDDLAFSQDGKTLASLERQSSIRLWDVASGKQKSVYRPAGLWETRLDFTPNDRILVTLGMHSARFWNLETMTTINPIGNQQDGLWSVAVEPGESRIALGDGHGRINFWDVRKRGVTMSLETGLEWVGGVAFSPNGESLLSTHLGESAQVWNVGSGKRLQTFRAAKDETEYWTGFTPDGRSIVSSTNNGEIRFTDARTGVLRKKWIAHDRATRNLCFHADGVKLATSVFGGAKVWDLSKSEPAATEWKSKRRPWHGFRCIALSAEGTVVATDGGFLFDEEGRTANRLGVIVLWDAATGKQLRVLEGHQGENVMSVAFNPVDGSLASSGDDGTVRIWNPRTGDLLRTITIGPAGGEVRKIIFSKDGRHLITLNGNGTVAVLRLAEASPKPTRE